MICNDRYALQICRDECEVLETDICKEEWKIASSMDMLNYQLVLPHCKNLPVIGTSMSYGCVRLGIPSVTQLIKPHSCYVDNGNDYRGSISMSQSGQICKPWYSSFKGDFGSHFELVGGHNYCRNPSGKDQQDEPWCYTSDMR